jgi:hypothetical protein
VRAEIEERERERERERVLSFLKKKFFQIHFQTFKLQSNKIHAFES